MNEIFLQVSLKALINNGNGEYLFLKRVKPYEGDTEPRYDLPGGKLIPGETLVQSLSREIFEETQLVLRGKPRVVEASDILKIAGKHTVRLTFDVVVERVAPVVLDPLEHVSYVWVPPREALLLYHDTYLTPALELLVGLQDV